MKLIKSLLIAATLLSAHGVLANTKKAAVGFLSQVKGDVMIDGKKAQSGDRVDVNSNIRTSANGTVTVLLGKGMVALIGYNTNATVEDFSQPVSKIGKTNIVIKNELAQINLASGTLRMLVSKDISTIRLATIRSGDAFGIVKDGEALFKCDESCAQKANNQKTVKSKVTK